MFFEQSQWRSAVLVVQVVLTSSRLCVSEEKGERGVALLVIVTECTAGDQPVLQRLPAQGELCHSEGAAIIHSHSLSSELTAVPCSLTQEGMVAGLLKMHR